MAGLKFAYPFVFKREENGGYLIESVDIQGAYTGINADDIAYGIEMAEEVLAMVLEDYLESGDALPAPTNIRDIEINDDEFVTLIKVDLGEYLDNQQLVKKTLSIPKWANNRGMKANVNFSKLLTDKIVEETLYR